MNKLKICLLLQGILLYALCGYSTTNKRAPAVMSVMRAGVSPTPAASVVFTVKFDEIVTNVTAASFSLTTSGLTGAGIFSIVSTGTGDTYTVTVNTGTGNTGTVRLNVTGTGIIPAMSGPVFLGGEIYAIDRTAPTGTLVIQGGALYTNTPTVPLAITATDDNDIFFEMRFSNNNVTWSTWEPFAATKNHTLTTGEGLKNVYMELRDRAGNTGVPVNAQIRLDMTPPAISAIVFPSNGYYKSGDAISFFVSYDEDVNVITTGGVPYIEMNIGGTIRRARFVGLAGSNTLIFHYTVVAGEMDLDGIGISNAIVLNGGAITDGVNDAELVLNRTSLPGVFVNTRLVSVALSTTAPSYLNAPFTVTTIFSEAVTNFTIADFAVSNATLSNLQTSDNITYTVVVGPVVDGPVSVQLLPGAVAGLGGVNSNTASNTLSLQYDATAPVINSVDMSPADDYNIGDVFYFTVRYNEIVNVNTTGGTPYLNVIIGGVTNRGFYLSGSGSNSVTFTYTVLGGELETTRVGLGNSIILNGGTIRDVAGNNANGALQNIAWENIKVYGIRPSATLSTTAASPVGAPYTLNAVFSEAVTGFTLTDLTVTNATLSNLQTTDNITYTLLVTPVADGPVAIDLPFGKVVSLYQNPNTASNQHTITYDNTPPAVTFVSVPAAKHYKTGEVLSFIVNYNENVTVTGIPSINLQVGVKAAQAVYQSGSSTNALTFSYIVADGDLDEDGVMPGTNVVLNSGSIKDVISNDALPALNNMGNTTGVLVYTAIPSVTLTTTAGALVNAPFSLQVQFSEAVTGLTISDFAVSNATPALLQTTDNILYTLQITPLADGTVSINLPPNVVVNKAGISNPTNSTLSITYDGTAPVISSVDVPANGYYKENGVLTFTVHTSEVIQGSGSPYLEVLIGPAIRQAAYVSGLGTNALIFSYVVQDGDMDMGGIALGTHLIRNNATLKDAAGNDLVLTLQNLGNTFSIRVNTSRPSATISTIAAARVNAAYTITIAFSEAVTGFTSTDLTITNGLAGNLQTTDNITYTALITPAADGTVTIALPADQAVNIAGNGNRASNTLSNSYDATAPVINAGQSFNVMERDPAGTVLGTATATETAGTLQNWAITSDGSGGAFAISANGTISVKDAALLNSKAGTTVTLSITVSDGLNTSAPTPVTVTIGSINKAPAFDLVADKEVCVTAATQTFSITGATATEAGQTFGFTINADQPLFDALTIDGAGLVSYQLKATASGKANITIIIKDNGGIVNGGIDAFPRTFAINVNSLPVVSISSNKGTAVSKGVEVQLTASGAATYNWGSTTGAVFTVRPQASTTYTVTGINAAGCPGTAQITINTTEDYKVDASNILTPNGDGINDKWVIRNIDSYPDNELKIFDRAGRIVYQRRNYSNDWDGTVNGRILMEGTYYYILTIDGSGKTVKGYITIIVDRK